MFINCILSGFFYTNQLKCIFEKNIFYEHSYMICFQLKYPTKYSIISMDENSNMGNLRFS